MGDKVADDPRADHQPERPYPLIWYLIGALSAKLSVPAMSRVIENAGLAGPGVALVMAMAAALLLGVMIVFIGRIERRIYRVALALLWGASILSLWYCSR